MVESVQGGQLARDSFVHRLSTFQTAGAFSGRASPHDRDVEQLIGRRNSFFAFAWDAASDRILPVNGWGTEKKLDGPASVHVDPQLRPRQAWYYQASNKLISELRASGAASLYHADLTDARLDLSATSYPVFQKNRRIGAPAAILWPNHDIGSPNFVGSKLVDPHSFEEKKPVAVWRGHLTGRSGAAGQTVPGLREAFAGNDIESARALLSANLRSALAFASLAQDRLDLGIVGPDVMIENASSLGEFAPIVRGRLTPVQHCKFRYMLAVPGADVATSFFWMAQTNSAVLHVDCDWEVFATGLFEPWVHYVPVKADVPDIVDKLAWCESHPREVAEIVRRAHEVCDLLADRDLRQAAQDEVVRLFERHVAGK